MVTIFPLLLKALESPRASPGLLVELPRSNTSSTPNLGRAHLAQEREKRVLTESPPTPLPTACTAVQRLTIVDS